MNVLKEVAKQLGLNPTGLDRSSLEAMVLSTCLQQRGGAELGGWRAREAARTGTAPVAAPSFRDFSGLGSRSESAFSHMRGAPAPSSGFRGVEPPTERGAAFAAMAARRQVLEPPRAAAAAAAAAYHQVPEPPRAAAAAAAPELPRAAAAPIGIMHPVVLSTASSKLQTYLAGTRMGSELDQLKRADAVVLTPEFRRFVVNGPIKFRHYKTGKVIDGKLYDRMTKNPEGGGYDLYDKLLDELDPETSRTEIERIELITAKGRQWVDTKGRRENKEMDQLRKILVSNVELFRASLSGVLPEEKRSVVKDKEVKKFVRVEVDQDEAW